MTERPCSQALDHILDARAANQLLHRVLINHDTPEVDSLIEAIVALPMSDETRRALAEYANRLLSLNARERDHELRAAGALDPLCARVGATVAVKRLAASLRPQINADWQDGAAYVRIVCTLRRYAEHPHVGSDVLRSQAMRHELGAGPHDRMCSLLGEIERIHRMDVAR